MSAHWTSRAGPTRNAAGFPQIPGIDRRVIHLYLITFASLPSIG